MTIRGRMAWGVSLLLVLLAAVAYHSAALRRPFFADDYFFLDQARNHHLLELIATPDPIGNFYRPVSRQLYFGVIAGAFGESPFAFHVANLVLLLGILALVSMLARRLAGARAAVIAPAVLALHYATDIPVRWASGSQDLLAVGLALAAITLHGSGRRWLAAAAMLAAAFSKEIVVLTPVIAVIVDRADGERWRTAAKRAWPLGVAVAVWALVFFTLPERHNASHSGEMDFAPAAVIAAYAHLAQVLIGLEWGRGGPWHTPIAMPPLVPLALVLVALAAIAWATRSGTVGADGTEVGSRRGIRVGIAWALIGALPVAAVSTIWSSYYYLFALCGVSIALASWLGRLPIALSAVVIAVLAAGSARAVLIDEYMARPDRWSSASRFNRYFIERSNRIAERYLEDLKRQRPTLPHRSTLFFMGLESNAVFQAADGPLVRWAYQDSSLRSHYLGAFTLERARRGSAFYFAAVNDSLVEMPGGTKVLLDLALGLIVGGQLEAARDALTLASESDSSSWTVRALAWVSLGLGDHARAIDLLRRAGISPSPGPAPELGSALAAVSAGDTTRAREIVQRGLASHGLDPGVHALAADLALLRDPRDADGTLDALASRVLDPEQPFAWRRWGMVQAARRRYLESMDSFDRYFALGGDAAQGDEEAHRWYASMRSAVAEGVPSTR